MKRDTRIGSRGKSKVKMKAQKGAQEGKRGKRLLPGSHRASMRAAVSDAAEVKQARWGWMLPLGLVTQRLMGAGAREQCVD